MELNVKDAARLLGVSTKSIYRWIGQQTMPFQQVNNQYRFNRAELLEWATANHIKVSPALVGADEGLVELPGLEDSLRAGGVHYRLVGTTKDDVLTEVVTLMPLPMEVDRTFLLEVLLARESLGSTGVGNGVAIPHVRNPIVLHVPRPVVSLCFLEHPIDFDAIDGKAVHALFTIVSPTTRGHLNLISRLAYGLQQEEFSGLIRRQGLREEIFSAAAEVDRLITEANRRRDA